MNRLGYYKQEYRKLRPSWQESYAIYRDIVNSYVNSETIILDVGCGHGSYMKPVYDKTSYTYSVEPDKEAIDKNTFIKNKIVASVENIPLESNFFDIVVLAWVLEHLPDPGKAFSEIYRVLKPGGKVVFLTPNVWNYNVWIIRMIPESFHAFFARKLYNRQDNDTYPKQYKINSVKKITRILQPLGFKKARLILNGDPSYISFNTFLFKLACLIEKILDFKCTQFMKVHLIGVYQK